MYGCDVEQIMMFLVIVVACWRFVCLLPSPPPFFPFIPLLFPFLFCRWMVTSSSAIDISFHPPIHPSIHHRIYMINCLPYTRTRKSLSTQSLAHLLTYSHSTHSTNSPYINPLFLPHPLPCPFAFVLPIVFQLSNVLIRPGPGGKEEFDLIDTLYYAITLPYLISSHPSIHSSINVYHIASQANKESSAFSKTPSKKAGLFHAVKHGEDAKRARGEGDGWGIRYPPCIHPCR